MNSELHALDAKLILSVNIEEDQDLVIARNRARQLAALLSFPQQDQTRIATAVSEIARNAHQYARRGRLDFSVDLKARPQFLWIQVRDHGPGIPDIDSIIAGDYTSPADMGIGLAGTSRLMSEFQVSSTPDRGTTVRFGKPIPTGSRPLETSDIGQLCATLAHQQSDGSSEELKLQNRDLLQTLDLLRQREGELERRQLDLARLNMELEETNRGVLALYAELDEKAVALRRADEMKSRFMSHVTHEFRTPVNSILALARLLLQRTDGDLLPEQEKQIAYIRDAARQLAEMVNDLLDLAKVESGKTEIHLSSIDLMQFLSGTRALMRPLVTTEAVTLTFAEPTASVVFESDENKLGQIVRNLISNALKFTQQGTVHVSAGLSPSERSLVFVVADTGIGIAPEDQQRIFHEFTQIENPIQRQVKGTGLGLPLSRKLAMLLGGTLDVESTVGQGSSFRLALPYRLPAADGSPQHGLPRKVILIIDDEPSSRYITRQLLRGTAYSIIEASGAEAAELARFESPVLIFLDLMMPDRSGFEVLNELKSDEETRHIPVVIHSSKQVGPQELVRLAGRQFAVLPKGGEEGSTALDRIRQLLGEPHLFPSETELIREGS